MFGTLQNRLPQEFRLRNITNITEVSLFLKKEFIKEFNKSFKKKPAKEESAFVKYNNKDLREILSIQNKKKVNNDNTISYKNQVIQICSDDKRYHYAKCEVTIHEDYDVNISVYYGPRNLEYKKINRREETIGG